MKRFISTKTVLPPYGLVTISGEVSRIRDADAETEGIMYSPFDVSDLSVRTDTEILQGWMMIQFQGSERKAYRCALENPEIEKCYEVLIEKYIDEEQAYKDTLIDEMIERGREYARNAYA